MRFLRGPRLSQSSRRLLLKLELEVIVLWKDDDFCEIEYRSWLQILCKVHALICSLF